ncbi:MAG: GAF domain-containing protein [Ignavibacteriales bacterium]|nr:GAF domain-containing protein [Ignavibacteriales bacterium]
MSDTITINKSLSDEEIYKSLLPQIEALININEPLISNLANVSAALKEAFNKISWVGFYLYRDGKLFLGPFQGKIACTVIEMNKGVCGTSAASKKTIIIDDVNKFPGHIACDSGSRSEIVIPLMKDEMIFGVFDLDSYEEGSFNKVDKKYLEMLCDHLTKKLSFERFTL